jgi:hypothetical protein
MSHASKVVQAYDRVLIAEIPPAWKQWAMGLISLLVLILLVLAIVALVKYLMSGRR